MKVIISNDKADRAVTRNNDMEMAMNIDGLKYTTKEINGCWKIKVAGVVEGTKVNTLVGVSGLVGMIGVDMANKLLDRAFRCMGDNQVCKLRRGLKITFYTY